MVIFEGQVSAGAKIRTPPVADMGEMIETRSVAGGANIRALACDVSARMTSSSGAPDTLRH